MSPALAAGLQIFLVVAALALVHVPLGDYLARVFTPVRHNRVERGLYRTLRIEASADQRWTTYLVSVLAFSVVSIAAAVGSAVDSVVAAVRQRHPEHAGGAGFQHRGQLRDEHQLAVLFR